MVAEEIRPHNVDEKENVAPQKRFHASRQGHGSQQQHHTLGEF